MSMICLASIHSCEHGEEQTQSHDRQSGVFERGFGEEKKG